MRKEVIKKIDDLTIEKWGFIFYNGMIYLDHYYLQKKESKKHRIFKDIKKYDRIMGRGNTIDENMVHIPDEVKSEVYNHFISSIKVLKWGERTNI